MSGPLFHSIDVDMLAHARPEVVGNGQTVSRRHFLAGTGAAAVAASGAIGFSLAQAEAASLNLPSELAEGTRAEAVLDALPGKKPLIKLSYRPPNYETPIEYFRTAITPNDAFFVRYHLSYIPEVDAASWKVAVGGEGANGQTELTLDDLRKMPAVEVVAVNQCSGNRRGLFQPHVPGVQWSYGAMGCARWKGARLKDVHEIGHPGAFATEEQRIAGGEFEAMEGGIPTSRQQDEAGAGVAAGQKRVPRGVAAHPFPCDIIERCAAQPPVVDEEAERLDQIDLDGKTGREAQQRAGILRDIGLIKGEAQIVQFRLGLHTILSAL